MLPLQTIDAFGAPATEYGYEPEVEDSFKVADKITYLSVDPSDTEVGLHLILVVLSNDNNRMHYVDAFAKLQTLVRRF